MAQKVSLVDLVARTEEVSVRGATLEVRAIKGSGLAALIKDFPESYKLLELKKMNAVQLLEVMPDFAVALMAHGLGVNEAPDEVAALREFAAGDQATLLAAVLRTTSPDGIGPFVALLEAVGGQSAVAAIAATRAQATP
jgi:hypothetical protein